MAGKWAISWQMNLRDRALGIFFPFLTRLEVLNERSVPGGNPHGGF